jgi:hypothetical protein
VIRKQSQQILKAMQEQDRAAKDVSTSTANLSRQVMTITRANKENCDKVNTLSGIINTTRQQTRQLAGRINALVQGNENNQPSG